MPENQLADLRRRLNDLRREIDEIGRREVPPSGGGFVTLTGAQTVAGVKTFSDDVIAAVIRRAVETGTLTLMGGTSTTQGPYIQLTGKDAGGSADGTIAYISTTESSASGDHIWYVFNGASATEEMRLTAAGILQVSGVFFGGSTLSTYADGTFAPVVADAATGGNTGSGTMFGFYTRTGNMVHVDISIVNVVTTSLTGTNGFFIRNLPYASSSASGYSAIGNVLITSAALTSIDVQVFIGANESSLTLWQNVNLGALDRIICNDISSGDTDIFLSITYLTD